MPDDYNITDKELARFARGIQDLWDVDLTQYRPARLRRRLRAMMNRVGVAALGDFLAHLQRDDQLSAKFQDGFTINVTRFMRDKHLFVELKKLLQADGFYQRCAKMWSAGCSYGVEPYSMAMIMDQLTPRGQWQIIATDIDEGALRRARQGVFSKKDLRDVSEAQRRRYFDCVGQGQYAIAARLRERVKFSKLDLLHPRGQQPRNCDVILCRNVVIYFNAEATAAVHQMLADSLRAGGILFIGATERLAEATQLQLSSIRPFLYRKARAA